MSVSMQCDVGDDDDVTIHIYSDLYALLALIVVVGRKVKQMNRMTR